MKNVRLCLLALVLPSVVYAFSAVGRPRTQVQRPGVTVRPATIEMLPEGETLGIWPMRWEVKAVSDRIYKGARKQRPDLSVYLGAGYDTFYLDGTAREYRIPGELSGVEFEYRLFRLNSQKEIGHWKCANDESAFRVGQEMADLVWSAGATGAN